MQFDMPTFVNVLGLVLTILFFVIGYRQTIGARKERARAANKRIVDVLFRRLTHEESFGLSATIVEKVLDGWALDARIRSSDMLSPEEIEALLLARVLDNDYVAAEQRKSIVGRIQGIFKEEPTISLSPDESAGLAKRQVERGILAIGSGIAAMAISLGTATIFTDATIFKETNFEAILVPLAAVVALTAVAMTLYSSLRDNSRSLRQDYNGASPAATFERAFFRSAKRYVPTLAPSRFPQLDFTFTDGGAAYGVETRYNVNRLGKARLKNLADMLRQTAANLGLEKVYLVSGVPPDAEAAEIGGGKVEIVSTSQFFGDRGGKASS